MVALKGSMVHRVMKNAQNSAKVLCVRETLHFAFMDVVMDTMVICVKQTVQNSANVMNVTETQVLVSMGVRRGTMVKCVIVRV